MAEQGRSRTLAGLTKLPDEAPKLEMDTGLPGPGLGHSEPAGLVEEGPRGLASVGGQEAFGGGGE